MIDSLPKKKIFSPITKKEEQTETKYEIEKGIPKHPLCLFSINKYHFGSNKSVNEIILNNEPNNPNVSNKITEQNNLKIF